ncbi:phosphoprotein [Sogatella furcifera hepe-like virus]|uniref:phosphoprotein n=1 Tax=Sogatella furcifera hepe-like virus TaxID=2152923 RepID=UPI000D1FFC75|nr:phosphoprotein [Sogatella furcifera hepe-like virus]AVV61533.1 phosphoprotein [Sogatella furcifera hepe-like virus]
MAASRNTKKTKPTPAPRRPVPAPRRRTIGRRLRESDFFTDALSALQRLATDPLSFLLLIPAFYLLSAHLTGKASDGLADVYSALYEWTSSNKTDTTFPGSIIARLEKAPERVYGFSVSLLPLSLRLQSRRFASYIAAAALAAYFGPKPSYTWSSMLAVAGFFFLSQRNARNRQIFLALIVCALVLLLLSSKNTEGRGATASSSASSTRS